MSLVTIPEASKWASDFLEKEVLPTNISYLFQYGKVKKHGENGSTMVDLNDLKKYYASYNGNREISWKKRLGDDLNWALSFYNLREKDTTKHVHRLHPYKGKFIPQLVKYFSDDHVDDFKKEIYFKQGDIILDPFAGSGTTLVQAKEIGMHSIGIDISRFNCLITEVKMLDYNFNTLEKDISDIKSTILNFESDNKIDQFDSELQYQLSIFNNKFFPSPEYKYKVQNELIDQGDYAKQKEIEFFQIYEKLVKKYNIKLKQNKENTFLDKWYIENIRNEIDFAFSQIKKIKDITNKKALAIILSRTIRSCRT